jgi:thiol-disulfide isomerase/thioredoxin
MNKDNISALLMAIGVISLIVGFAVYFNSPDLNKMGSSQQEQVQKLVSAATTKGNNNGAETITTIKLDKAQFASIDRSLFKKAPELTKISGYINTEPFKLADLKGKVVLLDIWTYSCINCIRTTPYLIDWNEKYADKGLVIVGVHAPEFEFEKNIDNVKAAVKKYGIKYPVVLDNEKGTWNAYENRYWPRKYLVDTEGYIRYDHIGEGGYAETEKVIQSLLAERAAQTGAKEISFVNTADLMRETGDDKNIQSLVDFSKIKTPELYFGYQLARAPLGNPEGYRPDQTVMYSIPKSNLNPNFIYLDGEWKNNADNMKLQSETGRIALVYSAKSANIVAGGKGQEVAVSEDGLPLVNGSRGADLSEAGRFTIDGQRLYNLSMHNGYGKHALVVDIKGKGFQIYTFTFG